MQEMALIRCNSLTDMYIICDIHVFSMHETCRIESGSDNLNYLGHLGHFLVAQVGLIRKLNYLDDPDF